MLHIVVIFKHHGTATVGQQLWRGRRLLNQGATWHQRTLQDGEPTFVMQRGVEAANQVVIVTLGPVEIGPKGLACHGGRLEVQQRRYRL